MEPKEAYNLWAAQYDTNQNRTRDLEAVALRVLLKDLPVTRCLEIGAGTGKNTVWLAQKAQEVTAVDLSAEMLKKARQKITAPHVTFKEADITSPWTFAEGLYNLVSFSLVLEHLENLHYVFKEAAAYLSPGGYLYLGELHPFKQYSGTKARFDTEEGRTEVECYTHHVSEFTQAAFVAGLKLVDLQEFFDEEKDSSPPRILTMVFQKP